MLSNNFEGVPLDLRDSNFKELTGFKREIIKESSFGTKAPNITNGIDTLYIHCDLISNSIVDGRYSDTIYTASTATLTRSYPFSKEPTKISYAKWTRQSLIVLEYILQMCLAE